MKKSIQFVLILLFPLLSFANTIQTLKVFDGTKGYCRNNYDVYKHRIGVYSVKGKRVYLESDSLNIGGDITFYQCEKKDEKYGFTPVGAFKVFKFKQVVSEDEIVNFTVNTKKIVLQAYVDGKYKIISKSEIVSRSARSQFKLNMDLNNVLSEEQQIALRTNGSVKAELDVFMIKTLEYKDDRSPKVSKHNIPYGNFRFHMEIYESNNGELLVKLN